MQKRRLGEYRIFPLTTVMEQRLIIQYLTPVGEYQDVLYLLFFRDNLPSISIDTKANRLLIFFYLM